MPKPFDREAFNTDPKHEGERTQFDAMVEDAFNRIAAKKKKNEPKPEEKGFLDDLIDGIFGRGNE